MGRRRSGAELGRLEERRLFSVIYVDVNAPATPLTGTSWATARRDLQAALTAATSADEIRVADGTYKPTTGFTNTISFQLKDGVTLNGGYAGYNAADPDARDPAATPTILSGDIGTQGSNYDNSFHVVNGTGVSASAILDGFTITGGNAPDGYTFGHGQGGGLFVDVGSPTVRNCIFTANNATGGGAAYLIDSNSAISNCTFRNNTVSGSGGALYIYALNSDSAVTISNCTFVRNTASYDAGAIEVFTNSYLSHNRPVITNSSFLGNKCSGTGGGIYASGQVANMTLENLTFVGNSAIMGGAIGAFWASITGYNCTMTANRVSGTNASGPATYTISGGYGSYDIRNSIAWNNVGPGGSSGFTQYNDLPEAPQFSNISADPQFVRASSPGADGNWGSIDDDYGDLRLQMTSPCVDATSTFSSTRSNTDIAGQPRFFDFPGVKNAGGIPGAPADMGAYETNLRLGLIQVPAGQTLTLPSGRYVFTTEQLSIASGAVLNLSNDDLIVDYAAGATSPIGSWNGSNYTGITGDIKAGRIVCTPAAAIGIAESSQAAWVSGADSTAVLIRRTRAGDADLNRVINGDDFFRIDASGPLAGGAISYSNGDFNLNGRIDADDYFLIDSNHNKGIFLPAAPLPSPLGAIAPAPAAFDVLEDPGKTLFDSI